MGKIKAQVKKAKPKDIRVSVSLNKKDKKLVKQKQKKLERRLEKRKAAIVETSIDLNLLPENTSEREYFDEYAHIFKSLRKLTRIAEKQYQKSKLSRDIYSLCTLYSQMRECIADLRSIQDLSQQSEKIIAEILDPMMRSMGESLVEMFFLIEKSMREQVKSDKQFQELQRILKEIFAKQALKIQGSNDNAKQRVVEFFANGV
jgi:hypothetical protein